MKSSTHFLCLSHSNVIYSCVFILLIGKILVVPVFWLCRSCTHILLTSPCALYHFVLPIKIYVYEFCICSLHGDVLVIYLLVLPTYPSICCSVVHALFLPIMVSLTWSWYHWPLLIWWGRPILLNLLILPLHTSICCLLDLAYCLPLS